MKGLRIGRTHSGPMKRTTDSEIVKKYKETNTLVITDLVSDFYRYFFPILNQTTKYYWILDLDSMTFRFPDDWYIDEWYDKETDMTRSKKLDEFESDILINKDNVIITKPDFLKKYGEYFTDDWCNIFGISSPFGEINNRANLLLCSGMEYNSLSEMTEICFFNIDSAYWEIFAKNEQLLYLVSESMKNKKGYYVAKIALSQKQV